VRFTVSAFLAVIGASYLFGILMVTLWVGLTPAQVSGAYRGASEAEVVADSESGREVPINLDQELAKEPEHVIDTRLLIQDTHIHLPVYALVALVLAGITLGLEWKPGWQLGVIAALFAAPLLDFSGMWLTKFVSGGFSYMTLAGGWTMAAAYVAITYMAIRQLWFVNFRRSAS